MENNIVFKDKKLSNIDSHILGISGENEQQVLVFSFEDGFVDGTGYLELEFPDGNKKFVELTKNVEDKTYILEVKNSLLKIKGTVTMQLRIVQEENKVYKTETFDMFVEEAINATETVEEQYITFVDSTNAKLLSIEKSIENKVDKEYVDKAIEDMGAPDIPVATSDLENDSGFITNAVNDLANYYLKSETYKKEEVNALIGAITTMNIQKVDALPTENISTTTIYFVPKTNAKTQDIYDEYVYINENWEHIGSTEIDLTGYATEEWVNIQIADFLSEGEVSTLINSVLENYYNKTEIDSELTKRDAEIAELKEENKVLKSQIPNGEAEGESITLEDSARDLEIEGLRVKGNTYQKTREGYNLFHADKEFPFTQKGLTLTKNEDGSITFNGTSTAGMNLNVSVGYNQEQQEAMSGKTYAFQIKTTGMGSIAGFGLKHSGNSDRLSIGNINGSGVFKKTQIYNKADTDIGVLYWTAWIHENITFDNFTLYPCLAEGTEYKDYEKYGVAPTIDEPSDIYCVTGDVDVAVRNKNLLDITNNSIIAPPGVTLIKTNNGRLHLEGIAMDACRINVLTNKIYLKAGTYTFSKNIFGTYSSNTFSLTMKNLKDNTMIKYGLGSGQTNRSFTISDDSEITHFTIESFTVGETYNFDVDLQLEEGLVATDYVEHKKIDYNISLGSLELLQGEYLQKISDKWYKHKVYEKIASYTNEEITTDYISLTGTLSEGATVYYKLENEVDIEIMDEGLIAQLESLNRLKTYKEKTHIDSVSDDLKPILSFEYKKDIDTRFNDFETRLNLLESEG